METQAAEPRGATIVLVHGAGAGAWCWEPLGRELDARGIAHVAVDLPTVGPGVDATLSSQADVAHVRSVLDAVDGPIVLCGNSYGGVVITGASAGHPRVRHLVYLAAFMPDGDEDLVSLSADACTPESMAVAIFRDDGLVELNAELTKKLSFQQAPAEVADWAAARLRPMAMRSGDPSTLTGVGWRTIDSTYVVCGDDQSIRPEAQRRWARERATKSVEVPFDHCPQLSHPVEIADLLAGIVAEVTT